METTYYLMFILMIVRLVYGREGTPLGSTEKTKTHHIKENQEVVGSSEKDALFKTKNISTLCGKAVTLLVETIDESEIQDIQWLKSEINFATTKPLIGVTIRDRRYDGRLMGTNDGSLIIHNLTMEDQGKYIADIFMINLKNYRIIYLLHISEEKDSHKTRAMGVIVSVIVLAVVVVVATIVMWKKKMCFENNRRSRGEKERSDPEGNSELEKELQQKASSSSPQNSYDEISDEEFHDAPETQEGT